MFYQHRLHGVHWICIGVFLVAFWSISTPVSATDSQGVIQAFEEQSVASDSASMESDKKEKHQILFFMGMLLLIGILTTAGLGIAMGVYGKPVFVAHMVSASLSVTLAIIHAIVAIVWFYPF